jgi:D-serine dehydratase
LPAIAEESNNFVGLPCSLGEGNGGVAAQCALRFSKDSQSAFASAMEELFKVECCRYGTSVDVREILRGILRSDSH